MSHLATHRAPRNRQPCPRLNAASLGTGPLKQQLGADIRSSLQTDMKRSAWAFNRLNSHDENESTRSREQEPAIGEPGAGIGPHLSTEMALGPRSWQLRPNVKSFAPQHEESFAISPPTDDQTCKDTWPDDEAPAISLAPLGVMAPLRVIETSVPHAEIYKTKPKRSCHVWSVSEVSTLQDPAYEQNCIAHAKETQDVRPYQRVGVKPRDHCPSDTDPNLDQLQNNWLCRWLEKVTTPATLELLSNLSDDPESHMCDIDALTGKLMTAIDYPITEVDQESKRKQDSRATWRQDNVTSENSIERELAARAKFAESVRAQKGQQPQIDTSCSEQRPEDWPTVDCTIRPAEVDDFQQIALLVNLGSQRPYPYFLGAREVTVEDIRNLHEACEETKRPFIVAVTSGDQFLDRSKWPAHSDKEYREYLWFRQAVPLRTGTVLGFALVTAARTGIFNTECPGSRHSGRVHVIVDPDHRGERVGSALLDRILISVAPCHRSLVDYKWHCEDPKEVYQNPVRYNLRAYNRLYVEFPTVPKRDDCVPRVKLLQGFGFKQIAVFEEAIKTDDHFDSDWLDLSVWELKLQATGDIPDTPPRS